MIQFKAICRKNTVTAGYLPEHEFNLVKKGEKYILQKNQELEGMNLVTGLFFNKDGDCLYHTLSFTILFCKDHLRILRN